MIDMKVNVESVVCLLFTAYKNDLWINHSSDALQTVKISGPTEVYLGDRIPLFCFSGPSLPGFDFIFTFPSVFNFLSMF